MRNIRDVIAMSFVLIGLFLAAGASSDFWSLIGYGLMITTILFGFKK